MSEVFSFASFILSLIGCACMLTDALGKPVAYIIAILDILDESNANNIVATTCIELLVAMLPTEKQLLLVQLLNYICPNMSTSTNLHIK